MPSSRNNAERARFARLHACASDARPNVSTLERCRRFYWRDVGDLASLLVRKRRGSQGSRKHRLRTQSAQNSAFGQWLRVLQRSSRGADCNTRWQFIRPGKPTQNAKIESLNGRSREELLNPHLSRSIAEVRAAADLWRADCNEVCPRAPRLVTRRRGDSRFKLSNPHSFQQRKEYPQVTTTLFAVSARPEPPLRPIATNRVPPSFCNPRPAHARRCRNARCDVGTRSTRPRARPRRSMRRGVAPA
jgi:hypothetical protein